MAAGGWWGPYGDHSCCTLTSAGAFLLCVNNMATFWMPALPQRLACISSVQRLMNWQDKLVGHNHTAHELAG